MHPFMGHMAYYGHYWSPFGFFFMFIIVMLVLRLIGGGRRRYGPRHWGGYYGPPPQNPPTQGMNTPQGYDDIGRGSNYQGYGSAYGYPPNPPQGGAGTVRVDTPTGMGEGAGTMRVEPNMGSGTGTVRVDNEAGPSGEPTRPLQKNPPEAPGEAPDERARMG